MVAECLDSARDALCLIAGSKTKHGQACLVVHQDISLILDLQAIHEVASVALARPLRMQGGRLFESPFREARLPCSIRMQLPDGPRQIGVQGGDRAKEPHASGWLLQIALRDDTGDLPQPFNENVA